MLHSEKMPNAYTGRQRFKCSALLGCYTEHLYQKHHNNTIPNPKRNSTGGFWVRGGDTVWGLKLSVTGWACLGLEYKPRAWGLRFRV